MADLLPCPFCGKAPSVEGEGYFAGVRTVICVTCGNKDCIGFGAVPPDTWNRRQPYLPPADVETLRDIAENTSDAAAFECLTAIIARVEGK